MIRLRSCGSDFKLVGSGFYIFEDSFDSIPISVCFVVKLETVAVERSL